MLMTSTEHGAMSSRTWRTSGSSRASASATTACRSAPVRSGPAFPLINRWDALTPTGVVRNQKGREAAVAYRDKACEPFHYSVMSYDERGRVEALLRYNENLGFDAVYYQYNSANQVIALDCGRSAHGDSRPGTATMRRGVSIPSGRSSKGRAAACSPVAGSITCTSPASRAIRGFEPEIVYSYTRTDQVATMRYPAIGTLVEYAYNHRSFLDSLVATAQRLDGFQPAIAL